MASKCEKQEKKNGECKKNVAVAAVVCSQCTKPVQQNGKPLKMIRLSH